jgi:polar amino acid transport system permease protein
MTLTALFEIHWSDYSSDLLSALLKTIEFTVAGFAGAALVGLVLALMRLSPTRALRIPAAVYTELFKNIPLLAIIFLIYFGLPSQGVKLNVFTAGTLSLIIFYAAYLSEIFRAAIGGVHGGQRWSTFANVVFPQALRSALPGTNTMLVDLLKSTSLLVTIAAAELMSQGQLIASETFRALEVYLVIAALYFALCYPLSQGLLWFERQIRDGVALLPRRRRRLRIARELLQEGVPA